MVSFKSPLYRGTLWDLCESAKKIKEKVAHIPVGDAVKSCCGKKMQNSELAAWISHISVNLEGKKKWIKADYLLKNFGQHILNNQTFPTIPDFRWCTGSVPVNSFSFEQGYISSNPWGFLLCPLAHAYLSQKKSLLYNLQGEKKTFPFQQKDFLDPFVTLNWHNFSWGL